MERINFFRLERAIQERFVASAQGVAPPVPLGVNKPLLPRGAWIWGAITLVSAVALCALIRLGYGKLESSFALHGDILGGFYVGLAALGAFSAMRVRAALLARRAQPFLRAIYLFPSGVIDTREAQFAVHRAGDLLDIKVGERSVRVRFSGGSFSFSTKDRAQGQEIERVLTDAKDRFSADVGPMSSRELAVLDPLIDNGFRNPFSPVESMLPVKPKLLSLPPILALLVGAALGFGIWKGRNLRAEDALYRAARAAQTKVAYQQYVERGGARSDVKDLLLPRAELSELVKKRSVDDIERYAINHPKSKILPEIKMALHRELLVSLEQAKKAGTRRALSDFEKRFGRHPSIRPEIARAVDAYLHRALDDFRERAKPSPEVYDLFRRVIAHAEKNDARTVEVRFRRKLGESVKRTEFQLRKSVYFGGGVSLPARYFDDAHSLEREKRTGKVLVDRLNQCFPDDLVKFVMAAVMPDSDEDEPAVQKKTVLVTHRTEMSGTYLSRRPRAALTGLGILFRVGFLIPKDEDPYQFKVSFWSAPDLKLTASGKSFEEIYDDMAQKGFRKLASKYLDELVPGLEEEKK